jgi:hypothetical protein
MQSIQTSPSGIVVGVLAALAVLGTPATARADDGASTAAPVTDAARNEMREQIKRELLAEMKSQMAADIKREVLAEMKTQMTEEIRRQVIAELTGGGGASPLVAQAAAGATADKSKARVVRVPYVPESMRREIREQVKQEVLAQAKEERWGNPTPQPEWLDRFHFVGDVRLRSDSFRLAKDNTPAGYNYISGSGMTRAADIASNTSLNYFPNQNTQDNFNRSRLRLRFGADIKVADTVSGGFLISTGSTSGPTSTNQTQGQGFNKYSLALDRGYVTLKPTPWLSLTGGRIANPFFSTDLVWADDLNFEGVAANYARALTPDVTAFITAGWFPLRTDNPLQTTSRNLDALQAGLTWHLAPTTDLKVGAAIYSYHGLEGQLEDDASYTSVADYGVRYEYPDGLRQRGNTLFVENAITDTSLRTFWGLASGFREFNLTGSLDIAKFDPVHVVLTGDYVKNLAFDRGKIAARTGSTVVDGKNYGYMGKLTVGHPTMTRWGDWNVSLAYRWLGSDAVLDAFTNSDFGMGGTNNKGYILGGSYGLDKNTWISARWMASQSIDSMAPSIQGDPTAPTKLKVDLLQIDLNAKF